MRTHDIRKAGSAVFCFAASALLACGIVWPSWAQGAFDSRLAVGLFCSWCISVAFMLHPQWSTGLAQGIREFCMAVRDAWDDIERWF